MAKRKRLDPMPSVLGLAERAPETKSMFSAPPIAQVAGEAAATSALREVAGELAAARAEGRMVQRLSLDQIEVDHLVRDRMQADDAEMEVLCASIRARGQQTPIEVVELPGGRYGLISGWRRLQALQRLQAEPDAQPGKFDTVLALLRRPDTAADAYLAMVEENEIRVGLSYYERARIAARAAELGVYPNPQLAIRALFASASRAKRSKIASFLLIHAELDGSLRFASAIPERLGLSLSHMLEKYEGLGAQVRRDLARLKPASDEAELDVLNHALMTGVILPKSGKTDPVIAEFADPAAETPPVFQFLPAAPSAAAEVAPGIWLQQSGPLDRPKLTLSGPGVDATLRARLEAWLRD
jgi:ParB family transcriptional regulator, chromosome partitioning protein